MFSNKSEKMKVVLITLFCLTSVCALRRISDSKPVSRIIGGQVARAGQYPWIAAIYKYTEEGRYFCAGSLWSEQWVLTAAQCVYGATNFVVQLGSNFLTGADPNRLTLAAEEYFHRPDFDPLTLRHDIGLIKLRLPISLTDYIQPVRRISSMAPIHHGRKVEAAGWGQTNDDGDIINELHFVDIYVVGQTECKDYYGEQLWGTMTCTEGPFNEGPCFGDTGTPLMTLHTNGNHTIQVALATFISHNGCDTLDPAGYTRIDAYYNWIVNVTKYN